MNSKIAWRSRVVFLILVALSFSARGAAFWDFDFESANVPNVPAFQPGSPVNVPDGLPGWTAYLGGVQVNQILHNNQSLGAASISIFGPQSASYQILQGNYTVLLQNSFPTPSETAAIAQTGLIPSSMHSIQFYAYSSGLQVSFAGQNIPLHILGGTSDGYYIMGGDVTSFAGQTGELRFEGSGYLDNIQFSTQAIPEPSTIALTVAGGLLFGVRRWRSSPRK